MKKLLILFILLLVINIILFIHNQSQGNIFIQGELSKEIIVFRIKNSDYKTTNNGSFTRYDYDLFMIYNHMNLEKIKELVGENKNSRFYALFNMNDKNRNDTIKILSLLYMNDYKKDVEEYFMENNISNNILKEICIPPLKEKDKKLWEELKKAGMIEALERDWDSKICELY